MARQQHPVTISGPLLACPRCNESGEIEFDMKVTSDIVVGFKKAETQETTTLSHGAVTTNSKEVGPGTDMFILKVPLTCAVCESQFDLALIQYIENEDGADAISINYIYDKEAQ